MAQSVIKHTIEDEAPSVVTIHQYGMVYPNGTLIWGGDNGSWSVSFKDLAEHDERADENWGKMLESRARSAAIPLADYEKAHKLVRRSITIAVTAPEDV